MGLNQNTVSSGEVANVVLKKIGNSDSGKANLSLSQTTFASPEGVNIPSQGDQSVVPLDGKTSTDTNPGSTPTSPNPSGTPTSTPPTKDANSSTPPKGATTGSTSTTPTTTSSRSPGTTPGGGASSTGAVSAPTLKGGVGARDVGGLAAAVKRVDAAHSTLQEQTGATGAVSTGAPTNADGEQKTATTDGASKEVDKTPSVGGTMQLAKVATPNAAGQVEKKDVEKTDLLVVQSDSAKKSDSNLGLKVAIGGILLVVLGAVFVVRRKLFT